MDGEGGQYFAPADGHFNQEGLYTGDPGGGGGYQDVEQAYDGQFAEFSPAGEYQNTNEFSPLSHVLRDGGVGISALAFDAQEHSWRNTPAFR